MAVMKKEIAERLRAIREISDVTVTWLAEKLGIPEAEYLTYETGDSDIPVSVLYEVCNQLNISMTELLTGEPAKLRVCSHVKAGRGIEVERNKAYKYQDLAYSFSGRRIEPLLVTVDPTPADTPLHPNSHFGHEYHYCLEGSYRFVINSKEFVVSEGDSLYFDSQFAHAMVAIGEKAAKILVIVI